MILIFQDYTESDLITIERQLGSSNLFIKAIIGRCRYGHPKVVLLDPCINENNSGKLNHQALSNLMWLTCPYLNSKIHNLENDGYIRKISDFINNDNACQSFMKAAHANFYFLRNYIYSRYVKNLSDDMPMDLFTRGIGGIRELDTIKCLHVHFCHYSVYKYNAAGYMTYLLLDRKVDCDDEMCAS